MNTGATDSGRWGRGSPGGSCPPELRPDGPTHPPGNRCQPGGNLGSLTWSPPFAYGPVIGSKVRVTAQPPSPAARPRRPTLLLGNGKGVVLRSLGGTCG